MIRPLLSRLGAAIALSLPLVGLAAISPAAADGQNASITITDKGFSPANVTIGLGGSVSFTNSGSNVHTATSTGGAPLSFNTGGLSRSQSSSISFGIPGTYPFNSGPDCLNGNSQVFDCRGGSITVTGSAAPAAAPAPAAPVAAPVGPAIAPAPVGNAPSSATVTITDTGMSPATVALAQGGTVTWVNNGKQVHTATTTGGGNPVPFDTGGLGGGQSGSLVFNTPGTYTFTSAVDCVNRSNPGGFMCGPYTLTVGNTPAAPGSQPAASGATVPVVGSSVVAIDDKTGFQPGTLTVSVGQTVTWTNQGNNVHTTTSNPGYYNAWDSGGLNKGQSFNKTFTVAGTYGYHSQTEPTYSTDTSSGNVIVSYTFNGTIVVQ